MKKYLLILLIVSIFSKRLRLLESKADAAATAKKFPNFGKLKEWGNAISSMWDKITGAFSSKSWDYIKDIKEQSGYEKLVLDTNYMSGKGARLSAWDLVWNKRLEEVKLSEKDLENFKDTIEFAKFSESSNFDVYTQGFTDGKGDTRLVNLLINVREEAKKFDYIIFDMKLGFKLAPDLVFRCKGSSHLGGMISNNEDKIEELQKTLTAEQAETIINYFKMLALKNIAGIVGISLKLKFDDE